MELGLSSPVAAIELIPLDRHLLTRPFEFVFWPYQLNYSKKLTRTYFKRRPAWRLALWLLPLLFVWGCRSDKVELLNHGYPEEIGQLMLNSCARAGCHNSQSAEAAGGLNLSSWDALYRGSRGGSAVVPGHPEMSFLMYAVNTDSSQGPMLSPTMPIGEAALSQQAYEMLRDWIADGARNAKGELRFPAKTGRRKWYVANQGCDQMAVLDAESGQVMDWIQVGRFPEFGEQPMTATVAPDQQSYYLAYLRHNTFLEQYSTLNDQKISEISIGAGDWANFAIEPSGRFGFALAATQGKITAVDLELGQVSQPPIYLFSDLFAIGFHPSQNQLYLPLISRNNLTKMAWDSIGRLSTLANIDLVQGQPGSSGNLAAYDIQFSPDGQRYFISCAEANELRIFDAQSDQLLQVLPTGDLPTKMAISERHGLLLLSCMEHLSAGNASSRGVVEIRSLSDGHLIKAIYTGFQPFAIAIDNVRDLALVANRNRLEEGPAPHHPSPCDGRSGNLSLIDLNRLELVKDYKMELLEDPFAIGIAF